MILWFLSAVSVHLVSFLCSLQRHVRIMFIYFIFLDLYEILLAHFFQQ